jgi:hypothetical protein
MYSGSGKHLLSPETQRLVEGIVNNPNPCLSLINKTISELRAEAVNSGNAVVCSIDWLNNISGNYDDDEIPTLAFYLAANYSAAETFKELVESSKDVPTTIKRIIAEMFFGGTKLPLWKVYGASKKSEKSYEYLGTIETFQKQSEIPEVEVLGISVYPHESKKCYNIKVVILEDIDEKFKHYIVLRAGTNDSSAFTSNFEGSGFQKIQLDKDISNIL